MNWNFRTLYAFLLVSIIAFVKPWIRNNRIFSWRTVGFRLISEILFQRRNDTPNTIPRPTLFHKGSNWSFDPSCRYGPPYFVSLWAAVNAARTRDIVTALNIRRIGCIIPNRIRSFVQRKLLYRNHIHWVVIIEADVRETAWLRAQALGRENSCIILSSTISTFLRSILTYRRESAAGVGDGGKGGRGRECVVELQDQNTRWYDAPVKAIKWRVLVNGGCCETGISVWKSESNISR